MDDALRENVIRSMHRLKHLDIRLPRDLNLNMGEFFVLMDHSKCHRPPHKPPDIAAIQNRLNVSRPAISQILNSLESKGYIRRGIDPADRRKISITLTDEGERVLGRFKEHQDHLLNVLVQRIGEDVLVEYIRLTNRICDLYDQIENETSSSAPEPHPT